MKTWEKEAIVWLFCLIFTGGCMTESQPSVPTEQPSPTPVHLPEEWCGWSTNAECSSDSDCGRGGCSGQICGSIGEGMSSTCEWLQCYDAEAYGVDCGCINRECQWYTANPNVTVNHG